MIAGYGSVVLVAMMVLVSACGSQAQPEDALLSSAGQTFDRPCRGDEVAVLGQADYDVKRLECALTRLFDGRGWTDLSRAEKTDAAEFLGRLYIVTGDETLQAFDFCPVYWEDLAPIIVNLAISRPVSHVPEGVSFDGVRPALEDYYWCEDGHAKPAIIPDPDYDAAKVSLAAWDGTCIGTAPYVDQIAAGVRLYVPEALACQFDLLLADRELQALTPEEQAELYVLAAAQLGISQSGSWESIDFCEISRNQRYWWRADVYQNRIWLQEQAEVRGEQPPAIDDLAQHFLWICEEDDKATP